MISCVDRDKKILVFRVLTDETGGTRRERIGAVQKKDFEIGADLASLGADELAELKSVIATYQEAAQLRSRVEALSFPETVTSVLHYLDTDATDDERKLIATAFAEGMRRLRRVAREGEASGTTDAASS